MPYEPPSELPPEPLPGPHNLAIQRRGVPGCGIAAYTLVLLVVFVVGVFGVVVAYSSIIDARENASPYRLTYGGTANPALLGPMRGMGLLARDEVPLVFHTEDLLGTQACALTATELLRLDRTGPQRLALAEITAVEEEPDGRVRAIGPTTIECPFGPDQGGDRFARMLRNPNGEPATP